MDTINYFRKSDNETDIEYIYRICSNKNNFSKTWDEISDILNKQFYDDPRLYITESAWRHKFYKIRNSFDNTNSVGGIFTEKELDVSDVATLVELDKKREQIREQRNAIGSMIRKTAREDSVVEDLLTSIKKVERTNDFAKANVEAAESPCAIYAMLSDLHYGLTFDNAAGCYDTDIAQTCVENYASEIIEKGKQNKTKTCYVSLMGDMVSGNIHPTIRLQNRINLIEQIVGASELVVRFLAMLATYFNDIHVNSVSGNHSRTEADLRNSLHAERLDDLIPWYCKEALKNIDTISFDKNPFDDNTIASFTIFDKFYVSVHGDMDTNIVKSCANIQKIAGKMPDVFLSAHMHVPEMTFDKTTFIRNGCICGSGDDYNFKNRLFGPPYQICMAVDDCGIRAIYPIAL